MNNAVCPKVNMLLVAMAVFSILHLNACTGSEIVTGTAPEITSADSVIFAEETAGTFTVAATGSPAPTFSISGTLPTGVTFDNSTGILSGTPAASTFAAYPLTITATNSVSPDATQNFTLRVSRTVDLVANGSFESVLASWSRATYTETGATGYCSYNGTTAPGIEILTSAVGFPATDGTQIVLGSVSSTSGTASRINCTLYQDIAIPSGTTSMTLSYDMAAKEGNDGCMNAGGVIGIYSTAAIPAIGTSPVVGTVAPLCTSVEGTSLQSYTRIMASTSSVAGTTVRLAFINAANVLGHEVIGIDNVKLMATVVP